MRLIVVVAYVLRKPSVHLNDDSGRGDSTAFDFNQPPIFCFSSGLHRGGTSWAAQEAHIPSDVSN